MHNGKNKINKVCVYKNVYPTSCNSNIDIKNENKTLDIEFNCNNYSEILDKYCKEVDPAGDYDTISPIKKYIINWISGIKS